MSATAPTHGDATRKHLVAWLMKRLKDPNIPKIHRKIKTYVYGLQVETLKELSGATCMWTRDPGPCGRAELEELMLRAVGCRVVEVSQDDGSETAMQLIDGVSSQVASIGVSKGLNEICGEKAKKRLRKARQYIDPNLKTMSFVVKDDIIDMVKCKGVTDQAEVERIAQQIWQEECFTLEIYCTDDGTEGTLAEFMRDWLKSGYSWGASSDHLKTLSRTTRKRALSPKFRNAAMKRLRINVARNYDPQDRDHTEDGEQSQLIEPLPARGDNEGSSGEVRFPWCLLWKS